MPSGRFDRRPRPAGTLTPPWRTVRPSTNDSGMLSRTEPSTIASGDPSAWAPVASLRMSPPPRSSSQSPAVKTRAPTRTIAATQTTA